MKILKPYDSYINEGESKSKSGYHANIEDLTTENGDFRRVLYTGDKLQLVLMSLAPGESIGSETHSVDQFFRFEAGIGTCKVNDREYEVADGDCVIIPAGSVHDVINTSNDEDLKMYTVYAPPHHKDGTVHHTKADVTEEEFDGGTTE